MTITGNIQHRSAYIGTLDVLTLRCPFRGSSTTPRLAVLLALPSRTQSEHPRCCFEDNGLRGRFAKRTRKEWCRAVPPATPEAAAMGAVCSGSMRIFEKREEKEVMCHATFRWLDQSPLP